MSSKWTPLNTASDLVAEYKPLIKGKTILTTGVTPGSIGAAFVEALAAASPSLLILAGRSTANLEKEAANVAQAAADASAGPVQTRNVVVDLLSLSSVRKAADEVNSWDDVPQIDVVVNCAGIMGSPFKLTEDGYESQFAANHLSHFLLTNLLMDKILAAPAPRVINVASNGHRVHPIRLDDVNFGVSDPYY
jgi:NAD(P)-dependent dehydrogenase (short-subunit alcohol dehydrogenase family)